MKDNLKTNASDEAQNPAFLVGAVIGGASSLSEAQIEHQIEMDEEEWGDDDDDEELLGYQCLGCENIQDNESGFGCDKCMGHCLEPWYS